MNYIWILLLFVYPATSDEVYQNSSHICDQCLCEDEDEFIMDCSRQQFEHVLANWPPHNKTLVATFSYNNISTLEKLPISTQKAKLVFDHCNIKYLDSGLFSNMKNVEYIDLSYNLLTTEEIGGDDFRGPYNDKRFRPIAVKYLNLAYNQIHSLPVKFFENMPDLEELNLQGNDFKVLDPTTQVALGSLTKIKVLNLADNELTEIEGSLLRNLPTLYSLDLSSNHLDFVPLTLSYISNNLKVLKISDNYIFKLTDQSFLGLDLIELHLNNLPRLNYVEANTFATLKHLKKLYLRDNENLNYIDKEAFGDNQIIDELDLSNNSLVNLDFKLINWSKLKILKINFNPLRCTCDLYNISQSLPKYITRKLDSPMCTDMENGDSTPVFFLKSTICSQDHPLHISNAIQHFNKIRIAMIVLSSLLLSGTIVTVILLLLRYRKTIAFRNYPFATQVSYYPIQTQHI
ncbi:leucine-rich repeat-containing protein 70 [Diorhabda sublineata]|uniref:leucine-rich repeat-containing protein 70 n=1 Tax=Diorhabda sublineata TaxID=1163346 RepID=UPI0024E16C42|nr:leucine-rich repeat-containing protein 70 [Diorhabda sublineata]